jgi:hypothetical protein
MKCPHPYLSQRTGRGSFDPVRLRLLRPNGEIFLHRYFEGGHREKRFKENSDCGGSASKETK